MARLETKSFDFEVKATNDNEMTFEGYGSIFGNVDSHRDIVEKGAFTKTINENKRIKLLYQHNPLMPIGRPIAMSEDSKGLYIKGRISPTDEGKRAYTLMKDGVLDELSIGYNTVKDDWDSKANVRHIKEVKLWEVSLVTFASNELANVTGVKSVEQLMFNLNNELKAGKVLSDKNKTLVKNAIDALTALLNQVEPPAGTQTEEEKAAEQIQKMILEMKNFTNK
jgi:uncharacterized protein